jgi:murein DD-endopeptidase MepM/ murein hydrolase activator NlpD
VFSISTGTVRLAEFRAGVGNYVAIELTGTGGLNPHGARNLHAAYAHLRTETTFNNLNVGQNVTTNTPIGRSGQTGDATGEHVCFRILTGVRTAMAANHFIPLTDYSDSINPLQFFARVTSTGVHSGVDFTHNFPESTAATRNWDNWRYYRQSLGAYRRFRNTDGTFTFVPHR